MKKIAILTGVLVALCAGSAFAAGSLGFSYTDCGSGIHASTFNCLSNNGTETIVGTYTSPVNLDSLNGNEIVIDMQTAGAVVPPWWQVKNTGTCRATSMSMNFSGFAGGCNDYWSGQALGGFGVLPQFEGHLNRQRILGVVAIDGLTAGPLSSGVETYSFALAINHAKTVGTGSCAGCTEGAAIVLNQITLTQNVGVSSKFGNLNAGTVPITGDGSIVGVTTNGGTALLGATAARNTTWGAVKSLYR